MTYECSWSMPPSTVVENGCDGGGAVWTNGDVLGCIGAAVARIGARVG
jgi:hypothetical protein